MYSTRLTGPVICALHHRIWHSSAIGPWRILYHPTVSGSTLVKIDPRVGPVSEDGRASSIFTHCLLERKKEKDRLHQIYIALLISLGRIGRKRLCERSEARFLNEMSDGLV